MTSKNPKFSIVMPTRNHAQYLPYALQSALQQTFDDYEIVVSDNCSTDATPEVVQRFASARIRHVRTERPVSMARNFEYGLEHATGDYVTFLPDDDAFSPFVLEESAKLLAAAPFDLVVWEYCYYCYGDWCDAWLRGSALIPPFAGEARTVDARQVIGNFFTKNIYSAWPFMSNCVYRRQFLAECKSQVPSLFSVQAGDIFCAVLTLSRIKTYIHVDKPLTVYGRRSGGTTASLAEDPEKVMQLSDEESRELRELVCDPLKLPLLACYATSAALRGKAAAGDFAADFDWNPTSYFTCCYGILWKMQSQGKDLGSALQHFETVLREQPQSVQEAVRKGIRHIRSSGIRQLVRGLIDKSYLLYQIELALRPRLRRRKARWIRGKDAGFSDILQCATKLDAMLEGKLSKHSTWKSR
jgi:hypothetical protein